MSSELYLGVMLLVVAGGVALYSLRATVGDVWAFLGAAGLGILAGILTLLRMRTDDERGDVFLEAVIDAQRAQAKKAEARYDELNRGVQRTKTEHETEKATPADEPNPETVERFNRL